MMRNWEKGKQFRKEITAVLTKRDLANPFQ